MYKVKGKNKEYSIEQNENGFFINGDEKFLEIEKTGDGQWFVLYKNRCLKIELITSEEDLYCISVNGNKYELAVKDDLALALDKIGIKESGGTGSIVLKAPMPGLIVDVVVQTGDEIKKGDPVITLEAMKMENVLKSERDGVVKEILVGNGDNVEKNQVLIQF